MSDLLQQGAAWLEGQRHDHLSHSVDYLRGPNSITIAATVGRTIFEQEDQFGIVQRTESRDFLVRTSDLTLGGQPATPQPGDRIRDTAGTETLLYEVMSPGGEPSFRYSDPQRLTLRIHTKFVGPEMAP